MLDYRLLGSCRVRKECKQSRDFTERAIIAANNDELPKSEWLEGSKGGICEGEDAPNCLPKFAKLREMTRIYYTTKAKIGVCSVRKSMSRVMKSLTCLLNDPLGFLLSGRDLITDASSEGCKAEREISNMTKCEQNGWTAANGWQYVMVVRDPVDRFLSGWLHMCVVGAVGHCEHNCFGCGPNMTCFLERTRKQLDEMAATGGYVSGVAKHMMPQNWFCQLHTYEKNYTFLHYDEDSGRFFRRELDPLLREQGVSDDLREYVQRRMIAGTTPHATKSFKLRSFLKERLLSSSYLLDRLVRLFYADYSTFGLDLPQLKSPNRKEA
ncbi:hypothetical protein M3Y99_00749300 [Aphelenchoides fujianensis]|nr:hypothetical protein M3Y99_00749300 [Aphelenchoides fujianensis]